MPGTSGVLSPFCKINGLTFNESIEPDNFMYAYFKDMQEEVKEEDEIPILVEMDSKEDYYEFLRKLHDFNNNEIHVSCKHKDDDEIIFEESELDLTSGKSNT